MQILSDKIEVEAKGIISTFSPLTKSIFSRGENQMASKSVSKICSVDGCERKRKSLGYCGTHYYRVWRWGDVTVNHIPMRGMNETERFWRRVKVTANDTRCWIWQGKPSPKGYGRYRFESKFRRVHVISWKIAQGHYPTLCVLHKCDTRLCVNPNHLFEGTHADNSQDMVQKGRSLQGERNPAAKLTTDKVLTARKLFAQGRKVRSLARQFGVSGTTMTQAISGVTWRHI